MVETGRNRANWVSTTSQVRKRTNDKTKKKEKEKKQAEGKEEVNQPKKEEK